MTRVLRVAIILTSFLTARGVLATTYYVDYVSGLDANSGTSNSTAWQHAPGMNGCTANCATASIRGGDSVILKGGVTWPHVVYTWSLPGGSSGSPVYIGVDKAWYAGSLWTRPILDAGGVAIASDHDLMFYVPSWVTVDNFEIKGFYWSTAACSGSAFGQCGIFNLSQNNGQTFANLYVHGWTHAGTGATTSNGVSNIFAGNGGTQSIVHDCVIDGTDVPGDHSVTAFFSGPPTVYNTWIKQVSSGFIVSPVGMTASYHDNHIEDVGPAYCNMPFPQYAGNCSHENGFEDNQDTGLYFYNNVIANVSAGLAVWIAPFPASTAYIWNNVIWAVHDNQVLDFAHPVYLSQFCSTGRNAQGYCNNAGTFVFYNNTVECGDDISQHDQCQSNVGFSSGAGFVYRNNHFITATTASGCASGAANCTFAASNVVQTLAQATAQGYISSQPYAFSRGSSGTATAGKGDNLTTYATGSMASLAKDTTYGIAYNLIDHTVVIPGRATNGRPSTTSTAWDSGAYYLSGGSSSGSVAPPTGLLAIVN